ncbi:1-phosphatidylinositol 4,5-bisphosphate phosphodiesterase eta-2a [Stegostoma tigrinum]|uniref:1-phosphatidylinositol 4,5-bisphosphate phosphodiesterase eta-2a n=1 Tax=Stegostoma tigrinum TaxID=3053191 RepID=UPI00286FE329|nr:1-phosphatidylinositol 4,5-bisphosphate phosphodiesterase eta-2a [Stegostoma tigrinum]
MMSFLKSHRLVARHQSSIYRLAEDFFWIGGSIVTPATWRLGQFVERCMSLMQSGTQMVKLRGSSKGLVRFYYLDEHKTCIRWRPSRKNEKAKISIDAIREVCEGKQSEIFQRYPEGSFDPNCCFSIYYGDHMESLDLVSSNGEEARTWITGLKYLMAGISDEDSLSKRQRTRDQWLKQTFAEADKNGDGCLSVGEVLQLMHKLNVNLPRQKVKQMFKEADTDENQGTLDFEEFCAFYKMMSTRRDLYLLMLMYSNHKDQLDCDGLKRFLEVEQKMTSVTKEHCLEIVDKFEPCLENRKQGVLGIDGFTNYMRSPAGDIFNPEHYKVSQDMTQPMCNYYIASSHNTYLMGDQLMSQSRVDMYAWVLQTGCRCVEVDCWDGPDGEPIVHHGYTLTSKILFRDVIETINKYAFAKSEYPVILSIENHCSVPQQKKMAQYLCEILGDKLDVSSVHVDDMTQLPSPDSLKGKILVKGKKLPANISDDAEEGEVSDEDSADEIEDDCKLMNGDAVANRKHVESVAKKKLDSLLKESKIRDREDPDSFSVNAIPQAGKLCQKSDSKKENCSSGSVSTMEKSGSKVEDGTDSGEDPTTNKRHSRSFIGSFSKRKKKTVKMKKSSSLEDDEEDHDHQASVCRTTVNVMRSGRQKKTMKLSRALSDLVKYTKSVGMYDIDSEVSCSWQVSSYSETKTHQLLQQKPQQFVRMNQQQLSRIYPSSYRVDSSNFNPQPFWNAGCQLVALNYQTEGRVLQLNRAKFNSNGNCGYVLKPKCMTQGNFNPTAEDLLSGQAKKQLVLRIISGQQLPKPKDSMLGDRGEIIDPFVEVEIIGLAVDCFKEQTRVVDDNGFNPMWEETLVFTLNMPELALVRFLVWDHDPIGRDFIGQRTLAFTSMMPGYRHVYLEGMEEASIFVHVAVNDISGKIKQVMGLKGLFHRNPKQASLDSHVAVLLTRKPSFSSQILRRTASAPTKGQPKSKKGFPQIVLDTKDYSSEGASESDDTSQPRFEQDAGCAETALDGADKAGTDGGVQTEAFKGKGMSQGSGEGQKPRATTGVVFSEPLRRAHRVRILDPEEQRPGVFTRCAINGCGRIGMATNCMKCVIGSRESPDLERKWKEHVHQPDSLAAAKQARQHSSSEHERLIPAVQCQPKQRWRCQGVHGVGCSRGEVDQLEVTGKGCDSPESQSLEGLGGLEHSYHLAQNPQKCPGTLQREMNSLFVQKMEEIRSKSPIFSTGVQPFSHPVPSIPMHTLETITEESMHLEDRTCTDSQQTSSSIVSSSGEGTTNSEEHLVPESSPPPPKSIKISTNNNRAIKAPEACYSEEQLENGAVCLGKHLLRGGNVCLVSNLHEASQDDDEASQFSDDNTRLCTSIDHSKTTMSSSQSPKESSLAPDGQCKEKAEILSDHLAQFDVLPMGSSASNSVQKESGETSDSKESAESQNCPTFDLISSSPPQGAQNGCDKHSPGCLVRTNIHPDIVRSISCDGRLIQSQQSLLVTPVQMCTSPVPAMSSDVTINDRIWCKLDSRNHRDSMSSSSSMSSNDTVIDLSLPNLARKSLSDLSSRQSETLEGLVMDKPIRPRSATTGHEMLTKVSKSKSNPNLRSHGDQQQVDDIQPKPLGKSLPIPGQSNSRRHTWNRLYMESLKQSSPTVKSITQSRKVADSPSKSKSLGDLTSDDIVPSFDSKYKSISRTFITKPMREQRRAAGIKRFTQDNLTEQLKRITSFERENDITSPTTGQPPETEDCSPVVLRRSSSRSQSRVRYIANRAKQAQERLRLQNLGQSNPSSMLEERGNPEGACCDAKSICTDVALPFQIPDEVKVPKTANNETEVFFMLKL